MAFMEDLPVMTYQVRQWTNPSVIGLAQGADPIDVIQNKTRETVLKAVEKGWHGPPYDPFHLAEILRINISPNSDVHDARTVPSTGTSFQIQFNPNRPHGRIRFSVAHEIAHTLFPDCAQNVRNRIQPGWFSEDEWQLELLCNVGAAEILMPYGYTDLEHEAIGIDNLLRLRSEYEVSTEALLLRIAKLTSQSCAIFSAARIADTDSVSDYRIDYSIPSRSWHPTIPSNFRVNASSIIAECTAVGFTAKGREKWSQALPEFDVECVGIPPFPGNRFPRIAGVLTSEDGSKSIALQIVYLFGDARDPRGDGARIIAHIVNDATPNWGRGFAREVKRRWSFIQDEFRDWVSQDRNNLVLGNVHHVAIDEELSIVHMIAQRGIGSSNRPRIRYFALSHALDQLAAIAIEQHASVHMPRIGTGQAGGSWELIRELIDERLVRQGIPVSIYTLPDSIPVELQGMFSL